MAISHESSQARPERRRLSVHLLVSEMWAALAIVVIWLAVLFDALFGPDILTSSNAGMNTARVPSAIVVALFAYLATHVIAKYGFGHRGERD